MANNVQVQETVSAVHYLQINCADLKYAIVQHCIEWQEKLCGLLYKMTDMNIMELYEYIKFNSEQFVISNLKPMVMKEPQNLDEMQYALILIDHLKEEVGFRELEFPLINDQLITLDKYSVPVPDLLRNLEKNIPKEWAKYLEVLEAAEKMLDYSKELYKRMARRRTIQDFIIRTSCSLREETKVLLEEFLKSGPFTSDIPASKGLAYLRNMRAKLQLIKDRDERIRNDLGIFGLSFPESLEMIRLEAELASLEVVWQLVDEWDHAWDSYKSGGFWSIETAEMEETAQNLFRKLTRLSRELKDKGWTVIEDTRQRVDAFRRTLPLLGDLKNSAMRPRHWDKVRKTVGVDFDENSPDFNLEAIFAMNLHNFADEINDISNAATMELQIEKGIKAIAEAWAVMKFEIARTETESIE
ncbi:hypothetical protein NQ318_015640 [Aromia moschata]|uniref:Dynein heavy chain linker domain-containing protein n=1 Tax=Aromia moschata TaxID=1265417 RepID=A0AAV8XDF7_9CUCU|nr:hypothetical protein NQ318_015640 [Aromia moschata]